MKKLLAFLGSVGLVAGATGPIVGCANKDSYKNDKIDISNEKINWTNLKLSAVNPSSLTARDVGDILNDIKNSILDGLQANKKLKDINPLDYTVSGLEDVIKEGANLSTQTTISFTITANSDSHFYGKLENQSINISVEPKEKIDISNEKINWTNLKLSAVNPSSLTSSDVIQILKIIKQEILKDLKTDTKLSEITESDYTVSGLEDVIKEGANLSTQTTISFTITANSDSHFYGKLENQSITVQAVNITKTDLSSIITDKHLKGRIEHDTTDKVMIERFLKELSKEYPSLYMSKVGAKNLSINWFNETGSLTIYSKDENFYTGSFDITFDWYFFW